MADDDADGPILNPFQLLRNLVSKLGIKTTLECCSWSKIASWRPLIQLPDGYMPTGDYGKLLENRILGNLSRKL
jgi:hypothetical protein